MNYYIIGGDGKEYGPVTDADVRQWIAEGRLNAQSMAKAESDAAFRPLSAFPEFAPSLGAPAPVPGMPPLMPPGPGSREAALQKIKAPAVGLIVAGSIDVLLCVIGTVRLLFTRPNLDQLDQAFQQLNNPQFEQFAHQALHIMYGPIGIIGQIFQLIISLLILAGAIKMHSLRSYEFALTAAILSVIPCLTECCAYPVGLVFGIWAITAMRRPDVKPYFT